MSNLILVNKIEQKIHVIRGHRVMLDNVLAELYGVETRVLIQAVKRNLSRFPSDFMFQINKSEMENLKSQIVISRWGGTRKLPYAFTEQGVAMLSSVLNSARAIQVNIQIMRVFTKMRDLVHFHGELYPLLEKLERKMERKFGIHASKIHQLFKVIKQLMGHSDRYERISTVHEARLNEHWKHISK